METNPDAFSAKNEKNNIFNLLKMKRKELQKLPDSTKVDCININMIPFKGGLDDVFRKLFDSLEGALQNSIQNDREEIEKFIKNALEKLNSNPSSVEEIEQMANDAI